ncbi:hypothetical protein MAPG_09322 [Magnaporthiopsis poae ATCC 64411]|uniref:Uncharacterized protein n=1 Tax=Magnaporthiopsis poae (strain ATCC 64411 / 73-15) TaxID=644358 RepID=A0A0C4E9M6_MAGP6|nr:hypothetical protein MAPG_09322 [Magnaporthiopsis poae ATCC 64411]
MKSTIASSVALLAAVASAAPAALEARVDGCPSWAPWPMGSPGDYWYPICCAYSLGDGDDHCCNRHPENGITYNGKPYKACPKPASQ